MRSGYLGLGSNVGDSAGHLRAAVDLLLLGDLELQTDRLTLPHPEVRSRRFVLAPLLELDPLLALPDGTRLADALRSLGDRQRVEKRGVLSGWET